jgi:uncharacterized protein YcbK (DUF882 family)
MADTTRRLFLMNASRAAAGLTLAGASPALAGMSPIYDGDVGQGVATYRANRGWDARIEYHALSEVQPEPAVSRKGLFPLPVRKPLRVDMGYEDNREHRLKLRVKRTGEIFDGVFRTGPIIYDDALGEIDHLLRDWRRDEVVKIDRGLIELLSMVQEEIGFDQAITVVSGYRSEATNRMLRRRLRGVAKNSYHVRGMAADIRLDGVSTNTLRKLALKMHAGGVGYYPRAGFIHLDTGPVRTWRG